MNREQLTLAVIAAGGENVSFTPVQVQKLFFLVDREAAHLTGGPHFSFKPYDYGPFDKQVYESLDLLAVGGLAEIGSAGRDRTYSLSDAGYIQGTEALAQLPKSAVDYLTKLSHWVHSLTFEQLVASIYNRYPDMKVKSIFRG